MVVQTFVSRSQLMTMMLYPAAMSLDGSIAGPEGDMS